MNVAGRRARTAVPVLLAVLLGSGGCGADRPADGGRAGFPVTVQSCDREVVIERPPQRVVTQGPEAPIFVAAAGAAERIVARNAEGGTPLGRYERDLRDIPVIGKDTLSREATIAMNPDLVVNRGPENDLGPDVLAAAGVDTVQVSGRCTLNDTGTKADGSFEQIYADLDKFGRIFGTEDAAAAAVADLRRRVAAVGERANRRPEGTTAAAVYIDARTVYTYGNQATIQTQMRALGLRNVFGDQNGRYLQASLEAVIARAPDVLIVLTDTGSLSTQQVVALPQLAGLRAVSDGRVLSIPFGLSAASPVAVDGLEQLAAQLAR